MFQLAHQFVDRETGQVRTERLFQDRLVRWLYSRARENSPTVFRAVTGSRATRLFGLLNYDLAWGGRLFGQRRFLRDLNVDLGECLDPPATLNTPRKVFERKIRYWDCRPLPDDPSAIVSPADARVLVGSLAQTSQVAVKDKFFRYEELLGVWQQGWLSAFRGGDFAIFRLTPEKYHYNHCPVSGRVVDHYEVAGAYHSCNPGAVVELATPYSKNRRVVTIFDTDLTDGSGVGLVAMIEIVALMIGRVEQCHSEHGYNEPRRVEPGLFVRRGQPKSLFRPGSSTDVLIFQPGRVEFAADLVANLNVTAASRFSQGFGRPLVETDVKVRSWLASGRAIGSLPCRDRSGTINHAAHERGRDWGTSQ